MGGIQAPLAPLQAISTFSPLRTAMRWGWCVALAGLTLGCGGPEAVESPELATATAAARPSPEINPDAVGLALEVENGVGKPLSVRAGQVFYINQIDLRAWRLSSQPEGVNTLRTDSDFAGLGWGGVALADQESGLMPGPTGFPHRRYYRGAAWMDSPSHFTVEQVDAQGNPTARPVDLRAGSNDERRETDDFFVRRLRAIHLTQDCSAPNHCAGASKFEEEALVELRHARTAARARTFTLHPTTARLLLRWNLRPGAPYEIPVTQVAQPNYAYGFKVAITPLTPPQADGTYAPGTTVSFRMTLQDGAGKALHPEGRLPTYNEAMWGANESGIAYYKGFFDAPAVYYRRKHREHNMSIQMLGPIHKTRPLRGILELGDFLGPDDVMTVGRPEQEGVFAQVGTVPASNKLFGGAIFPESGGWDAPVSDVMTFRLPDNAEPGTYVVTVKARRQYLGEDLPGTGNLEVQVGTTQRIPASLPTGNCFNCHKEGGNLNLVAHANANRATCNGCHVPLGFELEGPIFVRLHFIHSRSDRFDQPTSQCSTCHLAEESTQRTSKAACLSCHKSYPDSHVQEFGPIESMYVGGGRESFQQCTGACHTAHPGSGF